MSLVRVQPKAICRFLFRIRLEQYPRFSANIPSLRACESVLGLSDTIEDLSSSEWVVSQSKVPVPHGERTLDYLDCTLEFFSSSRL